MANVSKDLKSNQIQRNEIRRQNLDNYLPNLGDEFWDGKLVKDFELSRTQSSGIWHQNLDNCLNIQPNLRGGLWDGKRVKRFEI